MSSNIEKNDVPKKDDDQADLKVAANIPKVAGSPDAEKRLSTIKTDLFRAYPFLGYLVMSTDYYFTDALPTLAATTKPTNTIYINEKFLMKSLATREEACFVLAHEILHIFLDHVGRQIDRAYDAELWNIAADYCINSYLIELNNPSLKLPNAGLYDPRFKGMSADEIYHILLEENDNDVEKAKKAHGGDQIGGDYGDGKQRPFDVVSAEEVTEEARSSNHQKLATACAISNESDVKNMGQGAAALFRQFQDLFAPVIPWQDVLKDFIVNKAAGNYTYNKASRRSTHQIIFPRRDGGFIDIVFGVDTSGSMSSRDIAEAMSELKGICDEFDDWRLTLLSCDTDAHHIGEYLSEDGDDFSSVNPDLVGGGGTDMSPMVEYANEMEEEPSAVIILTDGYIPEVKHIQEIPVVLVVTSSGNKELVSNDPNMEVLFMNEKNGKK